ncbi:hypothetical protein HMPREF9629_01971 [Peptoanaerobacter stomatis]|uniref:UPF0210 protein HMPREF9629_01971 n=1 Tax=Peptoanaerobacter stomatis TaxID=796937 RepID=G9X0N5_9FIRM|nr:PFL family protein [Peptoanaerobacter stomatis]EHL15130.1 hypothetical protein HMPREF9629_01971 [Peptoanaerobacter stomatis]
MQFLNRDNILETINMLSDEKLDIRTVTMGISLLDCIDEDSKKSRQKIYDKISFKAEKLVSESEKIGKKYRVPIINKRISVTPISIIAGATRDTDYTDFAVILDKAAKNVGVNFVGGFSALVQKGMTRADEILIKSIPNALSSTDIVCSSVNVASTKAGINMDAIKMLGEVIKELSFRTKDKGSIGCAKLVVFANSVDDNPFMAGAFHGISMGDTVINVGISGPGVVKSALEKIKGKSIQAVCEEIKKTSFKMTRMGELIGREVAENLGYPFSSVDLSLAPTADIGDSVARILEEIGIDEAGGHGTTFALALLNDSVKKGGIMASSNVGGLSGAFIPVSEDEGMINAVANGSMSFDKLEAMTSVCSVGLDMIAIDGDTPASTISAIMADECAIGVINGKTTATRLVPVYGKHVGETVEFGDLLGYAPIIDIGKTSSERLINRAGFMPAPVHSFKN